MVEQSQKYIWGWFSVVVGGVLSVVQDVGRDQGEIYFLRWDSREDRRAVYVASNVVVYVRRVLFVLVFNIYRVVQFGSERKFKVAFFVVGV